MPFRSRPRRPSAASSLFQKRGVQILIIALIGIMAISMVAMAAIYVMDFYNEEGSTGKLCCRVTIALFLRICCHQNKSCV